VIFARAMSAVALAATLGMSAPQAGGLAWSGGEIAALHAQLDAALGDPYLRGAHVGFIAIDTARGTTLYEHGADDEMRGASNFKLLVGSAALRVLGPNFHFVTTVQADAAPVNGRIAGNVYLRGGGDAHLSGADLQDAAVQLRRAGVTSIGGSVVTDASHDDAVRHPPGWSWDDLAEEYGPAVTALELQDGIAHLYVSPGAAPGDPVRLRSDPPDDALTIENGAITGAAHSRDTTDVERPWNAPSTIRAIGRYPLGAPESDDLEPSLPDPESYAGHVLLRALDGAGVTVASGTRSGVTPSSAVTLWRHDSVAMPQLLGDFWLPSDNLMGELLLKELGVARNGEPGTYESGIAAESAYLTAIGVDDGTVSISDGSGSSAYDLITPRDLITILQSDWSGAQRDIALAALPQAGVNGTLTHSFVDTPLRGNVFAKTGSETHVRALSGFLQTARHGPVTFSLIINDWMGDRRPDTGAELAHVERRLLLPLYSSSG
jgi:D-alanyl-D-alanine carboxypeptidase/D-alanyl-D-alanine-endopeptidase (penicillin-binding protein 4)